MMTFTGNAIDQWFRTMQAGATHDTTMIYRRGDLPGVTVEALAMPSEVVADEYGGAVRDKVMKDFVLRAASLRDHGLDAPRLGDVIESGGKRYVITMEDPYRELDPAGGLLRIHTVYNGEATP